MTFIEVAVAAPIHNTLTYKSPSTGDIAIQPGHRVLVPLGRRLVTGYCLATNQPKPTDFQVKRINKVLDQEPIFPQALTPLFRWAANYYQYPIGEVIKTALPSGLTQKSNRIILLTEKGRKYLAKTITDRTPLWQHKLMDKGIITSREVKKLWKTKERKQLENLQDQELIHIEDGVSADAVKKKNEVCLRLKRDYQDGNWPEELKKSEKRTLDEIFSISKRKNLTWVARRDINKAYSGAGKAIKSLLKIDLLEISEQQIYRDPFGERPPYFPKPASLMAEQEDALLQIYPAIEEKRFKPFLLHGVTGSGKTEVYLRAAEKTLNCDRTVLVLVPEIALATQLEGHFLSRFGNTVALLHSGLTQGEKFDQWQRILQGEAKIVIGARSALFAPLLDPGLIIVDEEHDGAFKQDHNFRYNGRDMAVLRAQQQSSVVILGSATPSVTSYFHTQSNKYALLEMKKRVADRKLPGVEIVDLRAVKTTSGRPPLFSPQLYTSLRNNLRDGNQSLLFLNRRGYASMMICRDCGQTVQCNQCNVTLTLHNKRQELVCHYCGFSTKSAIVCTSCRSHQVEGVGFGTERIEEELKTLLPEANIARLDQDISDNRKEYMAILKGVHQREIDILVGTQMIAKGHHFPHVTLVGVVWADAGLGIPDYRSGERTFQLLTQVFGRAGRGEKPGRVIVQTHNPSHYSILTSRKHDYSTLYEKEITLRQKLGFPPYSRLINIMLEGKNEAQVSKAAYYLVELAKKSNISGISLLGPAPAPISKLRGLFRWHLMLKGTQVTKLKELCLHLLQTSIPGLQKNAVKLSVDVDPENML